MFDLDPSMLFLSIVLSIVGMAYYSYGKKDKPYFALAGGILLLLTFFISSFWILIGVGVACILLPLFLERL